MQREMEKRRHPAPVQLRCLCSSARPQPIPTRSALVHTHHETTNLANLVQILPTSCRCSHGAAAPVHREPWYHRQWQSPPQQTAEMHFARFPVEWGKRWQSPLSPCCRDARWFARWTGCGTDAVRSNRRGRPLSGGRAPERGRRYTGGGRVAGWKREAVQAWRGAPGIGRCRKRMRKGRGGRVVQGRHALGRMGKGRRGGSRAG